MKGLGWRVGLMGAVILLFVYLTAGNFVPKEDRPKVIVNNADEGEPGTFKDRLLLERHPHPTIEGVAIACLAIGAKVGYVYVRGEFGRGFQMLQNAIDEAEAAGDKQRGDDDRQDRLPGEPVDPLQGGEEHDKLDHDQGADLRLDVLDRRLQLERREFPGRNPQL